MTDDEFHKAVEDLGYRATAYKHPNRVEFLIQTRNGGAWEKFAEGHVKWDGCSNWIVAEDGFFVHFCSREQLTDVGALLAACWDYADSVLEH